MKKIKLFTDSSVNPQLKIGFAAFLKVTDEKVSLEEIKKEIKIKRFENTSSTKLELQTFLWAIEEINLNTSFLIEVYTDCQNIIGLPNRKEKIQSLNYHSSSGKLLNNSELYKDFFKLLEKYNCEFIKVKGHKKNSLKDEIDDIFNLVDKASRNALRQII